MHHVCPEGAVCRDSVGTDAMLRGKVFDPGERRRSLGSRRFAAERLDEEPLDPLLGGKVATIGYQPVGPLHGKIPHGRAVHEHECLCRHVRLVAAALRGLRAWRIEGRQERVGLVPDDADIDGSPCRATGIARAERPAVEPA